jgi:nucleoside-diphosphate-sugar epimerase
MTSLLVIGGSGFFGKSILDSYQRGLLNRFGITSIKVMARHADRLKMEAPNLLGDSITLLSTDISKCNSLPHADLIIHAAASTDARNYIARPKEERDNIQAGTYNFCKLATEYCRKAKILYISSGAVYGQQPQDIEMLREDFEGGMVDGLVLQKRDYAFAKRDGERAILSLGVYGLSISIARCFAFVGPYLPLHQHFAIGNFIQNGLEGKAIKVNAESLVYRSYLYADDLVEWLLSICTVASSVGPVFNVGSDTSIEIRELARKIADKFSVELLTQKLINRNVDRYIPSITKAQNVLGLKIKKDLNQSIDMTIDEISKMKLLAK